MVYRAVDGGVVGNVELDRFDWRCEEGGRRRRRRRSVLGQVARAHEDVVAREGGKLDR